MRATIVYAAGGVRPMVALVRVARRDAHQLQQHPSNGHLGTAKHHDHHDTGSADDRDHDDHHHRS